MQSSYISGLRGCVQYIPGLNLPLPPSQTLVHLTPTYSNISHLVEQCAYLLCAIGLDPDCGWGKNKARPGRHQVCNDVDSLRL